MSKYKQFIAGLIVGAVLFSIAPIHAAIEEYLCYKADYKVMINGEEYVSADLPILNYKGNTYAPFRSILEKAGLNVDWNAALGQAEVTSNPTSAQNNDVEGITMSTTATNIEYDPISKIPVGAEYIDKEKDGRSYKTINYNDKTYISEDDLLALYNIVYVTKGAFKNKTTNEFVTISLRNDSFPIETIRYIDFSLFSDIIGE